MILKRFIIALGLTLPMASLPVFADSDKNISEQGDNSNLHKPQSIQSSTDDAVYSSTLVVEPVASKPVIVPKVVPTEPVVTVKPLPPVAVTPEVKPIEPQSKPEVQHVYRDDLWQRVRVGFKLPELNDPLVQQHINWYAARPELVKRITARGSKYLYHMIQETERRGLPNELALLPFIESAYNPRAFSSAKAAGLWQFIPSTGKNYNLAQNGWQDQRRDVISSTSAALNYLTYLRDFQEGDWHLAIASYNWGEGAVKRAVNKNREHGLPSDFSSLRMPKETRNYVPKLMAVRAIIADPARYGIELPAVENKPYFAVFEPRKDVDVYKAASLAGISVDEFKDLNPSFRLGMLPASHNPRILIPMDKAQAFYDRMQNTESLSNWQVYVTQTGDRPEVVAQRYGMNIEQFRQVNALRKNTKLVAGRSLLVPTGVTPLPLSEIAKNTPVTPVAEAKPIAVVSDVAQPTQTMQPTSKSNFVKANYQVKETPAQVVKVRYQAKPIVKYHQVKPGETLIGIAERYDVDKATILADNRIPKGLVQRGQRLKIVIAPNQDAEKTAANTTVATKNSKNVAQNKPSFVKVQQKGQAPKPQVIGSAKTKRKD